MNDIKLPISVLVQTKNEELGIAACLVGLKEFDEVIVVDSNSADKTKEIALANGAKVVNFTWDGGYPKKKQWQLDNLEVEHEWVLFMDADETPTPNLLQELKDLFSKPAVLDKYSAFDVSLDYVFSGRKLKHGHRVTKRCLLRRGRIQFPVIDDLDITGMGELEGHYQPAVIGKVGQLQGRITHNDLDPVATWFDRHNRYSSWEANLRRRTEARLVARRHKTLKGRVFDSFPGKPFLFFLYAYFVRAGFLDGRAGFDYALALAFYYWQISLKQREVSFIRD